jgi:hypothetical protein
MDGESGEGGQGRTIFTATGLVRALLLVMLDKRLRGDAGLLERMGAFEREVFLLRGSVRAFHKAVGPSRQLHRLRL